MHELQHDNQHITLPKGGGALSGIGQNFSPDAFSGTGSYEIPFDLSTARGFEPHVSLNYNSGNGNSAFGLGFNYNLPKITILTSQGLPRYDGSDIYLFGGNELVKSRKKSYQDEQGWQVTEFIPRLEGQFDLITKHTKKDNSTSYWQVITADNETHIYGQSPVARVFDPNDSSRIFEWFIEQSVDDKGNKILYNYKPDDKSNVPEAQSNRSYINKYIHSIAYGNYFLEQDEQYAFEVIFDYGEYDLNLSKAGNNPYLTQKTWDFRPDAFSRYESGFEIRTARLCQNVLLFHHLEMELGDTCLVKRMSIEYEQSNHYQQTPVITPSTISSIQTTGYQRKGKSNTSAYLSKSLPKLNLGFSSFNSPVSPAFEELQVDEQNANNYLDEIGFQTVDLNSEGIAGLFYSDGDGAYYASPTGNGTYTTPQLQQTFPNSQQFDHGVSMFADLDSNGILDLVHHTDLGCGYFERTSKETWQNFQPFPQYPTNFQSHDAEHVDLSNNGKTDLIVVGESHMKMFASNGVQGYAAPVKVSLPEGFPLIKKGYLEEHVGFANVFGDGLSHRIRVSNGEVSCWPCLGYGLFGDQITLQNAPSFEGGLDISRLFITDVDGSGTADLVYVYADRIDVFINQNGNSFSDAISINLPEPYADHDQIRFTDILGNGTNCMVFTKMGVTPKHYFYNFIGTIEIDGQVQNCMKPYLLNTVDNGMGAYSQIQYCSSTKFYLEDKLAGNPWITKLPFPVQVVERTIHTDKIANSRFTRQFKYHDGYYDPVERTFRGFGFVESWDSEDFGTITKNASNNDQIDPKNFVPPVYTKTWHHTGAMFDGQSVDIQYSKQYWKGDGQAYDFPDSSLSTEIYGANDDTLRQAYVAMQGHVMRTEVYANDAEINPELAPNPYSVEQSNLQVQLYQPLGDETYASFLVLPSESISYHYERNPSDPRVQQHFVLETDTYGNTVLAGSVFLPRRTDADKLTYPQQQKLNATLEYHQYVTCPTAPKGIQVYNQRLFFHQVSESQNFEITGLTLVNKNEQMPHMTLESLKKQLSNIDLATGKNVVDFGNVPKNGIQAMQLSWERMFYWNQNQNDALPAGQVCSPLLVHHHEHACFAREWTVDVFGGRLIDAPTYSNQGYLDNVLYTKGGYFFDESSGYWWNKGLVQSYFTSQNPEAFYLPCATENFFAQQTQGTTHPQDASLCSKSTIQYDSYYLAATGSIKFLTCDHNEVQLSTKAQIDYAIMKPCQVTDINQNVSQALFDPLGQVIATTLFGTENGKPVGGMTLLPSDNTDAQYQQVANPTFEEVIANPQKYLQGATSYFFYNLDAWQENQQPASYVHLVRTQFNSEPSNANVPYCQVALGYSDGMGKELLSKSLTTPGMAYSVNTGGDIETSNGQPVEAQAAQRWEVTGRTLYNNKGHAFAQYLPYFSNSPLFENQASFDDGIPPSIVHFDPLGRQIRVDTPKGFFTKVEFTPWQEQHFDENDTILDSDNYQNTVLSSLSTQDQQSIMQAVAFYNTPHTKVYDNMGHPCFEIENNLGNVTTDLFTMKLSGAVTQQSIFSALQAAGYLQADPNHSGYTWLTDKFQPYTSGFQLGLPSQFQPYEQQIIDILRQSCLTSIYTSDILGRVTQMVDPRLYYSNLSQQTAYYNFHYQYAMDGKKPTYTDSADAGTDMHLHNIFGQQLWSWSPRGYCQLIEYDQLQRKVSVNSQCVTTQGVVTDYSSFNKVEVITYGESQSNPADNNLNGQLYQLQDLSGVILNTAYSITGELLTTSRQMVTDYQTPANWNNQPDLDSNVYTTQATYDALGTPITQTTPDGTITTNTYDQSGRLTAVDVQFSDGTKQNIVSAIQYDAKGQRMTIQYGNGTKTYYTYEDTTLRLLTLKTTRKNSSGGIDTLQNLIYTYDPVGNITTINDSSIETVFYANQKVEPICNYTYDALYRLTKATGRQHIGINANTYQNNQSDNSFMQCIYGPIPSSNDATALENYIENYTYDEAGNLKLKQHIASTSFTRNLAVEPNCNRLQGLTYDASGNLRTLSINSAVNLSFNCCENLVAAATITRDSIDDSDYYLYDSNEQRTRKVSVLSTQGNTSSSIEEKVYLGNYEIKRNYTGSISSANCNFERQGLRIMDDETCVAMVYTITQDTQNAAQVNTRQVRFQYANQLGSVTMELDQNAQLISYEEYFPYGGTALITGTNQTEVQDKEYRYSGKERDNSTGLYYYGYRYYAPWLCRWLKPDPAGTIDGMNLYAFVGGNPVGHRDVDGRMDEEPPTTRSKSKAQGNFELKELDVFSKHKGLGTGTPKWNYSESVTKKKVNEVPQATEEIINESIQLNKANNKQKRISATVLNFQIDYEDEEVQKKEVNTMQISGDVIATVRMKRENYKPVGWSYERLIPGISHIFEDKKRGILAKRFMEKMILKGKIIKSLRKEFKPRERALMYRLSSILFAEQARVNRAKTGGNKNKEDDLVRNIFVNMRKHSLKEIFMEDGSTHYYIGAKKHGGARKIKEHYGFKEDKENKIYSKKLV